MTEPAPQTTPTRDEAVPALLGIPASVVVAMSKRLGAVEPFNDLSDDDIAAMFRDGLAAYRASAPAPASGGVDAVADLIAGLSDFDHMMASHVGIGYFDGAEITREWDHLVRPAMDRLKADPSVSEAVRLERQTFKDAAAISVENDRLREALHDLLTRPTDGAARQRARTVLASLSPAATTVSEAEPVAWRWRPRDSGLWIYDPEPEWLERQGDAIEKQALYLAKPASSPAVREAAQKLVDRFPPDMPSHSPAADEVAALRAALQSTSAAELVALTADDERLLNKALDASTTYVYDIEPAPAAVDGQGWQDISTAPKDGSLILVPGRYGLAVTACWWPAAHLENHTLRGDWDDGERDEDGGFTSFNPTVWMPLPIVPARIRSSLASTDATEKTDG